MKRHSFSVSIWQSFLWVSTKSKGSEIKTLDFTKIKAFLHSKMELEGWKYNTLYKKDIFKSCPMEFVSRLHNYSTSTITNIHFKNGWRIKINGWRILIDISLNKTHKWQADEIMLSVIRHHGEVITIRMKEYYVFI